MIMLPKGAIIYKWLCSRTSKLVPKPLILAYGAKYKILQNVHSSKCHLSLMHRKYLPKIFIQNINAIYSSRIRAFILNSRYNKQL